jgi:hypothetical protein
VRKEITQVARQLKEKYRALFIADPKLKDRVARLLRSLLPPKPRRRGRPGRKDVTTAILLLARFRRMYPTERAELLWRRVYPLAIPNYNGMSEVEQTGRAAGVGGPSEVAEEAAVPSGNCREGQALIGGTCPVSPLTILNAILGLRDITVMGSGFTVLRALIR